MTSADLMNLALDLTHPGRSLRDCTEDERGNFKRRLCEAFRAIGIRVAYIGDDLWLYCPYVSLDQAETFLAVFGHPIPRSELEARVTLIEMSK